MLAIQAIVYCVIWWVYGYGSGAFRHRDNWEAAKLIYDVAGNVIPIGWTPQDKFLGFVGWGLIMPLPFVVAIYLLLTNYFPSLPAPSEKSSLLPLFLAMVCLPLGPALVNGGAFYSKFNSAPKFTIQKLRESEQAGNEVSCALVGLDPSASREEMERCVIEVETSSSDKEKREKLNPLLRNGLVKKFIQPSQSISIGRSIIEGAIDNWFYLTAYSISLGDALYRLKAGLRELSFLRTFSAEAVSSVVPVHRQEWFLDTYTEILLQKVKSSSYSGLYSMLDIVLFTISLETGWSKDAKVHIKESTLPKLKNAFLEVQDQLRRNQPEYFQEDSQNIRKKFAEELSHIMTISHRE